MNSAQKMVAELRCQYHAMGQALPELEYAANTLTGAELAKEMLEIGNKYNLLK